MKKFLIKTSFFSIPLLILLLEISFPINEFTYRPWEALLFKTKQGVAFPFYPNQRIEMDSEGDLCHHTKNAVTRKEYWTTDKLGFRNDSFCKRSDIILIGDSFVTGTGLPQKSMLSNVLATKLGVSVYSLAPVDFNDFKNLLENKILEKPRLIIFCCVERNVPAPLMSNTLQFIEGNGSRLAIIKDRITRFYALRYFISRLFGFRGQGVQGEASSNMFFLNGKFQTYDYKSAGLFAQRINSYKRYCDSLGSSFLFIPMPNKETTYYDYLPFSSQPKYLQQLDSLVKKENVNSLNIFKIFNEYRETNNQLLYQTDDSHLNINGIEVVSAEVANYVCKNHLLFYTNKNESFQNR